VTRQAALLLALGALATAAAVVSFGAWILLRRGRGDGDAPGPDDVEDPADDDAPAAGWIAD
jgi:hypothetical protein